MTDRAPGSPAACWPAAAPRSSSGPGDASYPARELPGIHAASSAQNPRSRSLSPLELPLLCPRSILLLWQAAADYFGLRVCVLTSYEEACFLEIQPLETRSERTLFLSFWAEVGRAAEGQGAGQDRGRPWRLGGLLTRLCERVGRWGRARRCGAGRCCQAVGSSLGCSGAWRCAAALHAGRPVRGLQRGWHSGEQRSGVRAQRVSQEPCRRCTTTQCTPPMSPRPRSPPRSSLAAAGSTTLSLGTARHCRTSAAGDRKRCCWLEGGPRLSAHFTPALLRAGGRRAPGPGPCEAVFLGCSPSLPALAVLSRQ